MSQASDFTLFVNSTDSFEDTWYPFFTLLSKFWSGPGTIVLNTETKSYAHPGLEIVATRVAKPGEGRIPWGECMRRGLERIPTERFVYLQDDYFLYDRVDTAKVREALDIVTAENLDCLRLLECGESGPYEPTGYPWLLEVVPEAHYRIALQAGIWTRSGMAKYLRPHESPWQMEIWGSRRARNIPGRIWAVNRGVYSECRSQIVPYVPTGIVKGLWNRDAVDELFASHNIEVDFAKRGWWDPHKDYRSSVGAKILKAPRYAWDRLRSY